MEILETRDLAMIIHEEKEERENGGITRYVNEREWLTIAQKYKSTVNNVKVRSRQHMITAAERTPLLSG